MEILLNILGWLAWCIVVYLAITFVYGTRIYAKSGIPLNSITCVQTFLWWAIALTFLFSNLSKLHIIWLVPISFLGARFIVLTGLPPIVAQIILLLTQIFMPIILLGVRVPDGGSKHGENTHYQSGGVALASDSTQENPSENRRDVQAYRASGNAHLRKLEQDQAIFEQTKAVEANPESPGVGRNYFLRGTAYYNKGQYDRAIDDYSNAIEHDAMFLGWIAEPGHIGWGDETRRQIQLNPETEEAFRLDVIKNTHQHQRYPFDYYYRASAHYAKGEYDKAILDYTKTIEIDPDMGPAHYFLAEAYLKTGNIDSALKHYDALKRLDEDAANGFLSRIQNMAEFSSMPTQQE